MAFEGKVILITGGNGGIGSGCALHFAKLGASLSLVGRNAKKFEKVLADIKQSGVKREPLVIIADVSTDAERIVSETIAKYNRIDVLINNAGFSSPGSIETTKIEEYDSMFATNVRGLLLVTQCAVPHLIASKGNVINVSSVAGLRAFAGYLSYCMSKAAVTQFTRCVALELAEKGVRVNAVNPAVIGTDFHLVNGTSASDYPAAMEFLGKCHPVGRVGEVREVVNAIAFLANENTTFITGTTLPVDGGLNIKNPFS